MPLIPVVARTGPTRSRPGRRSANVIFALSFEIRSDDDEYIFQFHN
ncbi:MAG: hypothetical protein U0800_22670 [Isosphaeraceae bacterium]